MLARAVGQGGGEGVEYGFGAAAPRCVAYGLDEFRERGLVSAVRGCPRGEFGAGGVGVVVLGEDAEQPAGRGVGEFADEGSVAAFGEQL